MKKSIVYALLALVVVFGTVAVYMYMNRDQWGGEKKSGGNVVTPGDNSNDVDEDETDRDIEDDPAKSYIEGFVFTEKYEGNNKWSYVITGTLPTPCYKYESDATVAESFPEQVTVTMTVSEPDADTVCAQVISDVKEEGTFSASEKAVIELVVVKKR